jgi:hypothetical protein
MTKYAKYASWLAKAIIAVAAVANAVMYFKTFEDVHMAMFGVDVATLSAFITADEVVELKKRIEIIESKQRGFMSFMKVTYDEQLDCKERVDNLIKTLSGDE